jgi:hypothetical protein
MSLSIDLEVFAAWFDAHRDPNSRVSGYEHALFMRWLVLGMPGAARVA